MSTTRKSKKKNLKFFIREIKLAMKKNKAIAAFAAIIGGIIALSIPLVIIFLVNTNNNNQHKKSPFDLGPGNPRGRVGRTETNAVPVSLAAKIPPTPTPAPLVKGPQTYEVRTNQNPDIYELYFNTIDPKGGIQTVNAKVKGTLVSGVTATINSDNKTKTVPLSFKSGNSGDGVWTASWSLDDTYNSRLQITFKATDQAGHKSSIDFTVR